MCHHWPASAQTLFLHDREHILRGQVHGFDGLNLFGRHGFLYLLNECIHFFLRGGVTAGDALQYLPERDELICLFRRHSEIGVFEFEGSDEQLCRKRKGIFGG